MQLIDADWLVQEIQVWRDWLAKTCGENDEYVLCLGEVLMKLDNTPTADAIPRALYEQIQWERDVALSQLKQLNIELGEKPYLKAIPIEWIEEYCAENWVEYSSQHDAIRRMLEDWRKENETR